MKNLPPITISQINLKNLPSPYSRSLCPTVGVVKQVAILTSIPAWRKTLRAGKIIGTLTLRILKSVYTSISPTFFYKLYSVANPGYLEALPLENHLRNIALTPDLQRVSIYSLRQPRTTYYFTYLRCNSTYVIIWQTCGCSGLWLTRD
jgi:hypothetical protein